MKKLVNQSKRLGVIALATMSLVAFSACGGDSSDRLEKLATKALKEKSSNAKILSFDEAQKEFGAKNKECFIKHKTVVGQGVTDFYAFVKIDDKTKGYRFTIFDKKDVVDISSVWDSTEIEAFKRELENCF